MDDFDFEAMVRRMWKALPVSVRMTFERHPVDEARRIEARVQELEVENKMLLEANERYQFVNEALLKQTDKYVAENERLRKHTCPPSVYRDSLEALQAENERLREALGLWKALGEQERATSE